MAVVIKFLYNGYNRLFHELNDPRVDNFPLMGSPWPVLTIVGVYVWFVTSWGQEWMKNRKPFELTTTINIFNIIQILVNIYIGTAGFIYSYFQPNFSLSCQPPTRGNSPAELKLLTVTYVYYLVKVSDLMDTVFFVLRKKSNQITFLHVYHHTGMVLASYMFNKFIAGSHGSLLGLINAWVHVVMYTYYFLTSFKPELKQSLWWKKYITQMQLIQFMILIIHYLVPLLFLKSCDFPSGVSMIGLIQNSFMFVLFSDFYYKSYIKKKPPKLDDQKTK